MPKCLSALCSGSVLILLLSCKHNYKEVPVTTGSLLDEMTSLERLTSMPDPGYKTIQFSSYDRRSTSPADSLWFSNEDGFGEEPIPGFEQVLKEPDSTGIGEYLICDVKSPGAILRLWSANINGKVKLYLDDLKSPVYEGDAEPFFWNTVESLSGMKSEINNFRQFDATYFPIPFSRRCRIEWTGDIRKIHFYHVGLRLYEKDIKVVTFRKDDIRKYSESITRAGKIFENPDTINNTEGINIQTAEKDVPALSRTNLVYISGEKAIRYLSVKINAEELESSLRTSILSIYFDNSSVPQIQAPVGDFFGSAPGLNPFSSLPFAVLEDSTMICRFIMPFKHSARIVIDNHSDKKIKVSCCINSPEFSWVDGKTMHFRARWHIDHGLTASLFGSKTNDISDIPYLMAIGQGRVVGAAAYLYNPSNAVTSWGNWWGEGDEKIFVDNDTFPSFYGTGSEDYFNYSWSSARIFSYPYCGQPRNDGPGNRGYVSNFRWHISDDILFEDKIAFYMELGHHGIVPGLSYGRIVYFYALPGLHDDYRQISINDISDVMYTKWSPLAYAGSAGFKFIQAEDIIVPGSSARVEKGKLWAENDILMWSPVKTGEKIRFQINADKASDKTNIGFTLAHSPVGGSVSISINGKHVKTGNKDSVNLFEPFQQLLDNHISESIQLLKGYNEIIFESLNAEKGKSVGIDFIWIKEKLSD